MSDYQPRIDRIQRMTNLTMRHTLGLSVFDGATHPGYGYLTVRHPLDCRCLMVRHTPPLCGTPLREGMARQRSIDNQSDAAAHPLSERGGRRPGCVALSNIDNLGVSHCHTSTIYVCCIVKQMFLLKAKHSKSAVDNLKETSKLLFNTNCH